MIRSILVGLDGSPCSQAATELGLRWAQKYNALLVGMGVVDAENISSPSAVPVGGGAFKSDTDEALVHEATRRVHQFLEHFELQATEVQVAHKLLEDTGTPWQRLVQQVQRFDLLLLGQTNNFLFATQEGPCGTLTKALNHTSRPIVMVPAEPVTGESILVAYDGSLQAARALYALVASGLAGNGPVHVLSIDQDKVQAARTANVAAEYLASHEVPSTVHANSGGDHASLVLEQAEGLEAGLIVMGAYGHTGLKEFFVGSTTKRLIAKSNVPLFLFH